MRQANFQLYTDVDTPIARAQEIPFDNFCNGWIIKNAGTTNIEIGIDIIVPGESKTYGGNAGEIYVGRKFVQFIVPVPAPAVITNLAIVTQKIFIEKRDY